MLLVIVGSREYDAEASNVRLPSKLSEIIMTTTHSSRLAAHDLVTFTQFFLQCVTSGRLDLFESSLR